MSALDNSYCLNRYPKCIKEYLSKVKEANSNCKQFHDKVSFCKDCHKHFWSSWFTD